MTKYFFTIICCVFMSTQLFAYTHIQDKAYGLDERQVFDLWMPNSSTQTALIIYIHGGGFKMGSKEEISRYDRLINSYLDRGIAFAAINYRFLQTTSLQDILKEDIAGFVQYIKFNAEEFNIDKDRIISYGESAGASASTWLATHNDIADKNSKNPVKRESSRIFAAGFINGQLSYDFVDWYNFYDKKILNKHLSWQLYSRYHFQSEQELYTDEGVIVRKDLNFYQNMDASDSPIVFLNYLDDDITRDYNHFIHSPQHAINLYNKAISLGLKTKIILKEDIQDEKHFELQSFFLEMLGF